MPEQNRLPEREGAVLSSRVMLILGFGGLLVLMALAGFDAVSELRQIKTANDAIRERFLARNRVLDQVRAELYLSGSDIRDYLLEPEAGDAEAQRDSLIKTREEMHSAIAAYRKLLGPEEVVPFDALTNELNGYWKIMEPALNWDAAQRRRRGYADLRDQIFPRRIAMLRIADRIAAINASQLNAGRQQVDRTFAIFHRRMMVTLGLSVGLGLLLALFSVNRILRLEREAGVRFREIATARAELRRLSARLVAAQEDERRSIARELHDEVGQALSAVLVEMSTLAAAIRGGEGHGALGGRVESTRKLVEGSVAVVRNIALLLRPSMLDDLGLVPALEWQAREVSKRTGIHVKVAASQVPDALPEEHKTCIYRVVQEALHNCERHSGARHVRVSVLRQEGRMILSVEDDGRGFNPRDRGMGLLGIEERVSNLDGKMEVHSSPGHGATLEVVLPLLQDAPAMAQEGAAR